MMKSNSDFSTLSLFVATPAQILVSHKRTWHQWGHGLTEEQYIKREALIGAMEHAANSRLITWVLAPRDSPTTLDFVASCETFRRRGLVVYPASDGNENEPREVTCYGIASVYTPPDQRGKGYGSHMMRLLHWVLAGRTEEYNLPEFPAEWGDPPDEVELAGKGFFSVLYSDIGNEFYTRLGPTFVDSGGWEARDPISTVWEVSPHSSNLETDDGWTWLGKEDLSRLWAKDVEQVKCIMAAMSALGSSVLVTFLPDQGLASSHTFRSALRPVSMHIWGVERDNGSNDQPTYAAWSVDMHPPPQTLVVTRISATKDIFPYLIEKIQQAARKNGITKMEIWDLPQNLLKAAEQLGGRTFKRDEHIPAIKWYGRGDTADIKWVFNEKFCWC